jgi:hypothetical protein
METPMDIEFVISKYKSTEDYSGLFTPQYEEKFFIYEPLKIDNATYGRGSNPSVSFYMQHNFIQYDREPVQTLVGGLSQVGGLMALFKVFIFFMYIFHQRLFEWSLKKSSEYPTEESLIGHHNINTVES